MLERRDAKMKRVVVAIVLTVLGVQFLLGLVTAQAPYYAGKTIEIIVPTAPGGGTDIQARLLAPYLEKHIPGNPRVVVRNIPGGGTIIGANWYAANAKPDGLTIFASTGSTVIPYLLGVPQVRYDFKKWRLIEANGLGGVVYVSPRTGVKHPKDLLSPKEPLVYGCISPTALDVVWLVAAELLRINFRAVCGFESRGPIRLAFERGELNIDWQTTLTYKTQLLPLERAGKLVPVMTMGFVNERGDVVRDPTVPELPTVYDVYRELYGRKPDGLPVWKAYKALLVAGFTYLKTYWVPMETPDEIVRTLYAAVDRIRRDPQFVREAEAVLEGYPLYRGDEVEAAVRRSLSVTLDVQKYIRQLLIQKYNVRNI